MTKHVKRQDLKFSIT